MEKLEKFQAELAKEILKWLKHFSSIAATYYSFGASNNEM